MSGPKGDASWRLRERHRKIKEGLWQGALLLILVAVFGSFIFNVSANLSARNIHSGFDFLFERSGFEIGESLITFNSSEAYFKAFLAGLLNTIKVSVLSIITATVLGIIVGLMRLSKHPLIKFLGALHVEFYRNIPLLVQLLLVYLVITELLPDSFDPIHFGSWAVLSKAGFQFALPNDWHISFVITTVSFVVSWLALRAAFIKKSTGLVATVSGFLGGVVISLLTWMICGFVFGWDKPEVQRFAIEGGGSLSPEFLALWFGLTFFTSAAIAEIFRAGFLAVPKGQWAAASALGMTKTEIISYIVFPQALKLAVPPLASQYMNLTKNSSLAVVVGYPDLVSIGNSTINLNGQALEVIVIIMSVFLTLNLITAVLMNWLNAKVTRGTNGS
ncbi:amino acid ABC transporter permease [Turicimonas muris]|uniref:amino acid ABC transporter permease n=4 Tax=Turicimonas muris TaxID=1796652 RepID=UPI001EBEB316|nr:ABC transporter permease subunit [Turicimonas muris]MBS4847331.1 ABC transporter permease subunit [Burkholderiales bacterium]